MKISALTQFFRRISVTMSKVAICLIAMQTQAQHHGHHAESGAHRVFDDPETYSESWDDPARHAWQRPADLVEALGVQAGMVVADIGTGTGYLLPYLSRAADTTGTVYAVDISPEMLAWVEDRAQKENLTNIIPVQASNDRSGLTEASIDRAIMINVWHHIADQDKYAADLFQSLKAGGRLFIVEAKPDVSLEVDPPQHFRMQPRDIVDQLLGAGFKAHVDEFDIDRQFVVSAEK